jgi:hypothetical protein
MELRRMTIQTRLQFQTEMRAAAVQMLRDFAADFDLELQIYPGRPRSIRPPCAFIDRLRETINFDGIRQRLVQVDVIVLHGLFDSKDAAAQKDAFVDGFVDWASDHYHAAGANTILEPRSIEDDPNYTPDWQPEEVQRSYYASLITLEGFAGG